MPASIWLHCSLSTFQGCPEGRCPFSESSRCPWELCVVNFLKEQLVLSMFACHQAHAAYLPSWLSTQQHLENLSYDSASEQRSHCALGCQKVIKPAAAAPAVMPSLPNLCGNRPSPHSACGGVQAPFAILVQPQTCALMVGLMGSGYHINAVQPVSSRSGQ